MDVKERAGIALAVLIGIVSLYFGLSQFIRDHTPPVPTRRFDTTKCVTIPDLPKGSLLTGKACVGMTKAEVAGQIGRPLQVNTDVTAAGKNEQWMYGDGKYLFYFENDTLIAFQEPSFIRIKRLSQH